MDEKRNRNRKWRVLRSDYLIRRPWLTARVDHVQLRNGNEIPEYYVLEYPDWVNVIALTREGKFIMVEQYRHGLGQVGIELCAGVVEEGEDPLQAARRELMEETGYGYGQWSLLCTLSGNASTMNNLTHCYLARDVEPVGTPHLDEGEELEVRLVERNEVKRLLLHDEVKQALMAAPLWRYFCLYESD